MNGICILELIGSPQDLLPSEWILNSLADLNVQERYLDYLNTHEVADRVLGFRKLREGIVSARRIDAFAIKAYEASVNACLLARNMNELFKSVSYLVETLYDAIPSSSSNSENQGRWRFIEMYAMLLLSLNTSLAHRDLSKRSSLHAAYLTIQRICNDGSPRVSARVHRLLVALAMDIDFELFSRVWWDELGDGDERSDLCFLLQPIVPVVQERTLCILKRAYFTLPTASACRFLLVGGLDDLQQILDVHSPSSIVSEDTHFIQLRPQGGGGAAAARVKKH